MPISTSADMPISKYRHIGNIFWLPLPILPILKNVPICRYFRYRYWYRPIPSGLLRFERVHLQAISPDKGGVPTSTCVLKNCVFFGTPSHAPADGLLAGECRSAGLVYFKAGTKGIFSCPRSMQICSISVSHESKQQNIDISDVFHPRDFTQWPTFNQTKSKQSTNLLKTLKCWERGKKSRQLRHKTVWKAECQCLEHANISIPNGNPWQKEVWLATEKLLHTQLYQEIFS